jgi:putative serine protease PepD
MTDTTDGPTGEAREGDVAETASTHEPASTHEERAATPESVATPEPAATPEPTANTADTPATGTVYHPGQEPQPYHAPQYAHQNAQNAQAAQAAPSAQSAPAANATAPTASLGAPVPPAFGGPRPAETQPTTPIGGAPANGATAEQPAPKPRRVGLGIAAAVVAAALIGGASGAGITSLIMSNQTPSSSGSGGEAQNIVVNDTDSVNQVTAVAAKASPSVVTISVAGGQGAGTGSGIILSEDGYVLTNTHVVTLDGATADPEIQVKTNDGHLYQAELVGTDPLSDLAVIKLVDASDLTPLEFADSDELNVGDTAIAIGAPLGLAGTVTNGIVSALNRSIDVASSAAPETPDNSEGDQGDGSEDPFDFFFDLPDPETGEPQQPSASSQVALPVIQTDAAINPGNSGGALLDSEGRLIGVNVAILSAGGASAEAGNIGVGFAVPSNLAERIANEIIENGFATHGLLGATVTSAEADGESDIVGALISEVSPGGAAEQAGLAAGDIVTEFNGVPITDQTDLTAQVRALPGGAQAEITFTRDGESQTVDVTLGTFEG